ncbi:hypothetical protein [Marivita sp. GX14005]|uniref:hypothetical protein n=1 Tax=Marivita sp. GX14005 TaxID=2942276 RepID=UPI002019A2F5|nr:hypothetical protein [Marivita sp. GX14005]MCL3881762.1 hypothetical protein [Marivita sp. GX14005]
MLKVAFVAIMLLIMFGASKGSANTAIVRGGEHDNFTRVTFSFSSPFDLESSNIADHAVSLKISPQVNELDISSLHDRLLYGRVDNIVKDDSSIEILTTCDCDAEISQYNARLLVIDIYDRPKLPKRILQQFPLPPLLPQKTTADRDSASMEFERVDMSLIDRVSRIVSSSLSLTPMMKPDISAIVHEEISTTPTGNDDSTEGAIRSDCTMEERFWKRLFTAVEGDPKQSVRQREALFTFDEEGGVELVEAMYLMSQGLLHEAKALLSSKAISGPERESAEQIIMVLTNDHNGKVNCKPKSGLALSFTRWLSGVALSDDETLRAMQAFSKLTLGMQLTLAELVKENEAISRSEAGTAILAHRVVEKELMGLPTKRRQGDASYAEHGADPDTLAAISVAARDTEHEEDVSIALFESYLEADRFFDAYEMMTDVPDNNHAEAVGRLLANLAEHSDPLAVFEFLALHGDDFSVNSLSPVIVRLLNDGFDEELKPLLEKKGDVTAKFPSSEYQKAKNENLDAAGSLLSPEPGLEISAPDTKAPYEAPTVEQARQRLSTASSLRESLVEQFRE